MSIMSIRLFRNAGFQGLPWPIWVDIRFLWWILFIGIKIYPFIMRSRIENIKPYYLNIKREMRDIKEEARNASSI